MKQAISVLIVEDEYIVAMTMQSELADAGYDVVGLAATADRAVELAAGNRPDVILMDLRLKGTGDGVDAAFRIHDKGIKSAVIFVTGSAEPQSLARIAQDHPDGIVFKPTTMSDIEKAIRKALQH